MCLCVYACCTIHAHYALQKRNYTYIMLPKPYNPADAAQVSPTQNPNVVHHTHVHNYIIRLIYWWLHTVQTHADAQQ